MSKFHFIKQVQKLSIPVEEAWNFFSSPENLVKLTPASLDLKIASELNGKEIYTGQLITYKVKPVLGIRLLWVNEITHVERRLNYLLMNKEKGHIKSGIMNIILNQCMEVQK
jgi:ligand-binding SRPBCC domain-containing protein